MPEPGTPAWVDFLKRLKEEAPEDYRSALLLGGGLTQALQREIARSQRRDAINNLFSRLFMREHPTGKVPDKRKIGLLLFLVVGGLFAFAFFFGTAPKKEAKGGGIGAVAAGKLAEGGSVKWEGEQSSQSSTKESAQNTQGPNKDLPVVNASPSEGSVAGAVSSLAATDGSSSTPSATGANGASATAGATGGTGAVPNLPPPPPPVYGSYGSSAPPPPDSSLASGQTGGYTVSPPPMVLYAAPGMPQGASSAPQAASPAPAPTVEQTASGQSLPGGMQVYTGQTGGMLVVSSPAPSGMSVSGVGQVALPEGQTHPTLPPVNPPSYPSEMPGGGR